MLNGTLCNIEIYHMLEKNIKHRSKRAARSSNTEKQFDAIDGCIVREVVKTRKSSVSVASTLAIVCTKGRTVYICLG